MKKLFLMAMIAALACALCVPAVSAQEKEEGKKPAKAVKEAKELSPEQAERQRFSEAQSAIRKEEMEINKKFNEEVGTKVEEAKKAAPDAKPEDLKVDINAIAASYKDQIKAVTAKQFDAELEHSKKMLELSGAAVDKEKEAAKIAEEMKKSIANSIRSYGISKTRSGLRSRSPRKNGEKEEEFDKDFKYEEMLNDAKINEYAKMLAEEMQKRAMKSVADREANKDKEIEAQCESKIKGLVSQGNRMLKTPARPRREPAARKAPEKKEAEEDTK